MDGGIINERTTAFLIRSRLNYDMKTIKEYIVERYPTIDCIESKSSYLKLSLNGISLEEILADFVINEIHTMIEDEIPDNIDLDDIISSNIDIFFDITYGMDDSVLVENAEINF